MPERGGHEHGGRGGVKHSRIELKFFLGGLGTQETNPFNEELDPIKSPFFGTP